MPPPSLLKRSVAKRRPQPARAPHPPAPVSSLVRDELATALRTLTQASRPAEVLDVVAPWKPVAQQRAREAAGSPADSARWADLLRGIQGPVAEAALAGDTTAAAELARDARSLLRALRMTVPPRVPVAQIADALRHKLLAADHAPYARLSARRLASEGGYPLPDVALALTDLAVEGVTQRTGTAWHIARGLSRSVNRSGMVEQFLHALITARVFRPGSQLPTHLQLARRLTVSTRVVSAALHNLHAAGLVRRESTRLVIACVYPVPGSPDVTALPEHTGPLGRRLHQECSDARRQARYHWVRVLNWPPGQRHAVWSQQAGAVRHYALLAGQDLHARPSQEQQFVQDQITYAVACATLPVREELPEQLWRLAVLCNAVAELRGLVSRQEHSS